MLPSDRVTHYVRPNETVRVPRRHIFLDAEARLARVHKGHIQTWRLAVACFRTAIKGRRPMEHWAEYLLPTDLWLDVDRHCGKQDRTVLWTHNVGYDIRITDVLRILPRLGWELTGQNLTSRGTWLQWRKGKASLVMVDSGSVLPTTLERVGAAHGLSKLEVDPWSDDDATWMRRCRRDVEILRLAVVSYLDWIEAEELGNWQLTGAGQAWASFRHRFLTHRLLVHDDADALAAERRAAWTGRCEAYWHGALSWQVVHEWDLPTAYARVARDVGVPVHLVGPMPDHYDWRGVADSGRVAVLARVSVDTRSPVVPTQLEGRILWPIGRFDTTLWDVEIMAALRAGAQVTVHSGWLYRKRPALKVWAEWILTQLARPDAEVPAWQKLILRHWSRALIGRLSMQYTDWQELATTSTLDVRRSRCYDRDTKEEYDLLQVGRTLWRDAGTVEWGQSMPAITSYVMAACRVRLWDIMQALPPNSVLYCDTDSIIVSDRWLDAVAKVAQSPIGHGLRLKRSWDGFEILGPRQIVTGNQVRVSGVSKKAEQVARGRYEGEVWESLRAALGRSHGAEVHVRDRRWTVEGTDHRRSGPPFGWTEPIKIDEGK